MHCGFFAHAVDHRYRLFDCFPQPTDLCGRVGVIIVFLNCSGNTKRKARSVSDLPAPNRDPQPGQTVASRGDRR